MPSFWSASAKALQNSRLRTLHTAHHSAMLQTRQVASYAIEKGPGDVVRLTARSAAPRSGSARTRG